ncbi:MAG: hypothetical protein NTZ05_19850 [Chloroflexi bacterium]|nr:hypothetical protein [Chloroflexota bacterium]
MDLLTLKHLVRAVYKKFEAQGYFYQAFGYYCVDEGDVPGSAGSDINDYMLIRIWKANLWPIVDKIESYSENDLFSVIEFLFDQISLPINGTYHSYNNCGTHYSEFDPLPARKEYCEEINAILGDYKDGYELSVNGEILELGDRGLQTLLKADLPMLDPDNVELRVQQAVLKFRRRGASPDERREVVRALADVLEFLRPRLQTAITKKDESDLFSIINNYGIRHHDGKQKTDYDPAYLSWMFYNILSTIHLALRRIGQEKK